MAENMKYLSFLHIKGFNGLDNAYKELFIDLYKEYVSRKPIEKRGQFAESQIKSVYLNQDGDFWVTFKNGRTYTYFNRKSPIEKQYAEYLVSAPDPKLTIKTRIEYINNLQNVIFSINDINGLSSDIMNVMYYVVKKLTLSVYRKNLIEDFIKSAVEIRHRLLLVRKLNNNELLMQSIEDAVFFVNGVVLAYLNDTNGQDKELYQGISIFFRVSTRKRTARKNV